VVFAFPFVDIVVVVVVVVTDDVVGAENLAVV
jgi:hypothetical protein